MNINIVFIVAVVIVNIMAIIFIVNIIVEVFSQMSSGGS